MAERIAEIVILCEDLRQANFAWHYLKRDGHSYRKLRLQVSRGGQGSGEQYVREQYRKEVGLYRNRSTRRTAALVVMIDADTNSTAYRERQLARQARRKRAEKIAHLIPRRHIETWILCLTGETVDETSDYKSTKDIDGKIKPAAKNFYDWSHDGYSVPSHCVSSLQNGLKEIRRVD